MSGTPSDLADVPQSWPVHESEDLFRGDSPFAVRRDVISRPGDTETFSRVVVEHPGAVVVLALDDEENVLVLRQYRHPPEMRLVELPAGLLDVPDEDPVVAARRELVEEASCDADEWEHLSTLHTSPGICSERIEIFLATGLREAPDRGGFEPEHEEADMTVHRVPFDDLLDGVLACRLTDSPLVVAVLAYAVRTGRTGSRRPGSEADPA